MSDNKQVTPQSATDLIHEIVNKTTKILANHDEKTTTELCKKIIGGQLYGEVKLFMQELKKLNPDEKLYKVVMDDLVTEFRRFSVDNKLKHLLEIPDALKFLLTMEKTASGKLVWRHADEFEKVRRHYCTILGMPWSWESLTAEL
jgi:hypothetical protein